MKLTEVQELFAELDVIKLDPDRTDVYDIIHALLPTLVRISYANMVEDQRKYNRTHASEDDERFQFTKETLIETVNDLIASLRKRFDAVDDKMIGDVIETIKSEFKTQLETNDEAK